MLLELIAVENEAADVWCRVCGRFMYPAHYVMSVGWKLEMMTFHTCPICTKGDDNAR